MRLILAVQNKSYRIVDTVCTIGREDSNIKITSPEASKRHAVIFQDVNGQLRIRDLSSTNGTFVNGERVKEAVLSSGMEIQVGGIDIAVLAYRSGQGNHVE